MAATVSLGTFIADKGGDNAVSAVQAKPRFAVDQQQLLVGIPAPWIPPDTCSPAVVYVMKGANLGQARMPQTLNDVRQTLRAGQHEHPAGPLQRMAAKSARSVSNEPS